MKSNYKQRLTTLPKETPGIMDTPEKWENIPSCINVAAEEAIGEKDVDVLAKLNNWYHEECRKTHEVRNEARKKMLQRRMRATVEEYRYKICGKHM